MVRTGRALAHLPAMAEACAAGHLTAEQAAVIGRVTEPEHLARAAEQGVDLSAVDVVLTDIARERPHTDVVTAVHHYLDRLDADGPEPDPTEGRRLAIARHADGSITGRFDLDAVGGEKLQTALGPSCRPAGVPPTSGPAPSSRPTRWCSCATTSWPPVSCPCSVGTSRR
jgi:hypothetical protein